MARGQDDQLEHVSVGDEVLAEHHNALVDAVRRVSGDEDYYADGIGTFHLPPPPLTVWFWGKLDGDLAAGGSATVSLWKNADGGWDVEDQAAGLDSGINVTAFAPPVMTAGTITTGTWLRVYWTGRRYVADMREC